MAGQTGVPEIIAHFAGDGPRRYARWNASVFEDIASGPARVLGEHVRAQANAAQVLSSYLRLVQEAVGLGYLDRASVDRILGKTPPAAFASMPLETEIARQPDNLFVLCLLRLIPETIATVPEEEQLPLLARVWNLAEGLLREPAWLNRYVAATASRITDLSHIEETLADILEPALATTSIARFTGPFTTSLLDTRRIYAEFLPGDMHLAAPSVLCVHDRRHPKAHIGVFLRHNEESRCTDLVPCLGPSDEKAPAIAVSLHEGGIALGRHRIPLPFLRVPHRYEVARTGFIVLSAVDSQRLWIVESP